MAAQRAVSSGRQKTASSLLCALWLPLLHCCSLSLSLPISVPLDCFAALLYSSCSSADSLSSVLLCLVPLSSLFSPCSLLPFLFSSSSLSSLARFSLYHRILPPSCSTPWTCFCCSDTYHIHSLHIHLWSRSGILSTWGLPVSVAYRHGFALWRITER